MAFNINSSAGALNTIQNLFHGQNGVDKNLTALASAKALNKAADDAASLAISNKLMTEASGFSQSMMNANESIGMIQIADGAMQEQSDIANRIDQLTLQASNDTLNNSDRAKIQKEVDRLLESSDNIASSTSYNGMSLLDGSNATQYTKDSTSSSLFGKIDVTTAENAQKSLDTVQNALSTLDDMRSDLGSSQNKLYAEVNNLSSSVVNSQSASSQLGDLDFAKESADFSKNDILFKTGSFALSQQNLQQASVLNLLQ